MADQVKVPDFVTSEFFVNRRDIVVEWGHCDPAGIVFHPRFIEYFDWCCVLLVESATGLTKAEMGKIFDFAGIPIVDLKTKFLGQVTYGDKVAVECVQTRVWCGHDPENPSRLRSRPIPEEVVAKLRLV